MAQHVQKIEAEAVQLSKKDRAELVRRLIATLDQGHDVDAEQVWLDEAERRLSSYQKGDSKSIPAENVFDALLSSH
jgi:putative addiction module component (TIGR02574 family)